MTEAATISHYHSDCFNALGTNHVTPTRKPSEPIAQEHYHEAYFASPSQESTRAHAGKRPMNRQTTAQFGHYHSSKISETTPWFDSVETESFSVDPFIAELKAALAKMRDAAGPRFQRTDETSVRAA